MGRRPVARRPPDPTSGVFVPVGFPPPPPPEVAVGVPVGVPVEVAVAVLVDVPVDVAVAVFVGVPVAVTAGVFVGVPVGVLVVVLARGPTVTVKLPVEVFPSASVAEQCTIVVLMGKVSPELWSQEGVTAPSAASRAETAKVAGAPFALIADLEMLPGRESTGGTVSVVRNCEKYGPIPSGTSLVRVVRSRLRAHGDAASQDRGHARRWGRSSQLQVAADIGRSERAREHALDRARFAAVRDRGRRLDACAGSHAQVQPVAHHQDTADRVEVVLGDAHEAHALVESPRHGHHLHGVQPER